jgi:integrase
MLLCRPLASITTQGMLAALAPLQDMYPKQAARVRANVALIFDYAIARGLFASANPAASSIFRFMLPPPPPSIPHRMMPVENPLPSHLCLQWLICTAARSQEAIRVEWADINVDAHLWVVPPHKIKMRKAHKVPLSSAAVSVLTHARQLYGDTGYVFHGQTKGSPMSPRILESVMHQHMREPYSVHALRASFSTWCNDRTAFDFNDVEACLAHQVGNAVSRAYDRADRLAKRAVILQAWGDFVSRQQESNVVPFVAAARL